MHSNSFLNREGNLAQFVLIKGANFKTYGLNVIFSGINNVLSRIPQKPYAECIMRYLKSMMFQYFTANQLYRYNNIFQDLVLIYNSRPHRPIGLQLA